MTPNTFILTSMAAFLLIALASVIHAKPFNNIRNEDGKADSFHSPTSTGEARNGRSH